MLMGLVAKNSILLVEFAIEEMRSGKDRLTALLEAGHKRARPIVMTSFAMIAGMLPLALGIAGDAALQGQMAIAVIGGLVTSTALTLVMVPAAFTWIDDFEHWLARRLRLHIGSKERGAGCSAGRATREGLAARAAAIAAPDQWRECASIQFWASSLTARASRPAATIGGPITTRIVPGLLVQTAPRPVITGIVRDRHDQPVVLGRQQRAADAVATRLAGRPCGCLREISPPMVPAASRALPCASTLRTAAPPAPRSTAIARIKRTAQPRNGTQVSSRLSTHTWSGSSTTCAKVSQLEECLSSAM